MTPERWEQVKAIFASAVEISPADRESYVRQATGADTALFREVLSLLAADAATGEFSSIAQRTGPSGARGRVEEFTHTPDVEDHRAKFAVSAHVPDRAEVKTGSRLRFEPRLESEYAVEYFSRSLPVVRAAILLAIFLYAVFAVLDASVAPAQRVTLWTIRAIVISGVALLYAYSYRPEFERVWQASIWGMTFIGALGIMAMIALIPAPSSYLYYAGLMLLTIYSCTVVRLYFLYAATLSAAIFVTYAATAVWLGTPPVIMFTHFMMLFSANVLALSANFALDRYNRRDFRQRRTIEARTLELESKNRQLNAANLELVRSQDEIMRSSRRNELLFAALTEALPGTVLDDKYRLDEKIGTGGFGTVYRALHLLLERTVAVKVLKPSTGDLLSDLNGFRSEGIAACRLVHPNAVNVLDSGVTGGVAYLVMELLQGRSLADELRACGALPLDRCCTIVEPLCAVLTEAHSSGLVHRDLKPSNVFLHRVGQNEIVKIIDFGLAKIVEPQAGATASMRVSLALAGTPGYMAPERLAGKKGGTSEDIYSLAVMVMEMLSGQQPFALSDADESEHDDGRVLLASASSRIPREVTELLNRALSVDPHDRPSAEQFRCSFVDATHKFARASHPDHLRNAPLLSPPESQTGRP